jgi:uncharacterized protein YjdB
MLHPFTRRVPSARHCFKPLLAVLMLVACSGDATTGSGITDPPSANRAINDLSAIATSDTSIAVTFTAVSYGAAQPVAYEVRYAPHPMDWGSASTVTKGTCSPPIASPAAGQTIACSINGLMPSTTYDVQAVSFEGTLNVNAKFGAPSNVGTITTPAVFRVVTRVSVTPDSLTGNVGDHGQFSAVAADAAGRSLTGRTVQWSSSNTAVVTVDATGLGTGVGAGTASVIATIDGVSGYAQVTVNGAASVGDTTHTVASVVVSPDTATLRVGASRTLTATILDAQGAPLSGITTTWTSSAPSVASVNSNGVVTAVSVGEAAITGLSGGHAGTAAITVIAASGDTGGSASGEPTPGASVLFQDDFESYQSAANLLSAYSHMNGESGIQLDPTGGLNGSRAMRIDWAQRTPSSGCTDDDHLVEEGFSATPEIYAQYDVRYGAGFVFDWNGFSGCSGNAKKLFLMPGGSGSRLDLISENHHIVLYEDQVGYATGLQNVGSEFTPEMLGDGAWHRITIHARLSSSPGANDGIIEGWIDGVKHWSHPNPVSGSGYTYFQTPTVFNTGSPVAQSEWMDNLVVWKP